MINFFTSNAIDYVKKNTPILGLIALLYPFSSTAQQAGPNSNDRPGIHESGVSDSINNVASAIANTETDTRSANFIPLGYASTSILKPIDGAVTGVQMTNGGGQPGASPGMAIRGVSCFFANNNPLIVLDGAPYNGNIASLSIQDIKTIVILKDAMATLPYGSRGGNGVVEIETKKGTAAGAARLNIDARFGTVTRGIPDYDVLTSEKDYYETMYEAGINAGYTRSELLQSFEGYNAYNVPLAQLFNAEGKVNPGASLKYHDSWNDKLLRTGLKHDYNISYSDKIANNSIYIGGGYLNEQGYVVGAGLERINLTANGSTLLLPWLKTGLNTNISVAKNSYNELPGEHTAIDVARQMAPIYPVYYYDAAGQRQIDPITGQDQYDFGDLALFPQNSMGNRLYEGGQNRVASLATNNIYTRALSFNVNPYLEGTILKRLKVRVAAYYNGIKSTDVFQEFQSQVNSRTDASAGIYTINQSVTWNPDWEDHHLAIVAGNEFYKLNSRYHRTITTDVNQAPTTEAGEDDNSLSGYFVRGRYDYKSRYILSAGFRHDHNSNLRPWLRGNNFWAMSLGYVISQENFLKDNPWLNLLKLRFTYGSQGSFGLPYRSYPYQTLDYAVANNAFPDINAAKQLQATLGLDMILFDRLTATIDWYNRKAPTDINHLFNTRDIMVGNKGLEFSLSADIIRHSKIAWNTTLNFTKNTNKLFNVPAGNNTRVYQDNYLIQDGDPLFQLSVPDYAGPDPIDGHALYITSDGTGKKQTTKDVKSVKAPDYKLEGSVFPAVYGSLTNALSWNRFNFSFRLNYSIGGKYYDQVYQNLMGGGPYGSNWHTDILNRWTPENSSSNIPAINSDEPTPVSSRFVASASYLSIRNVYLAYDLASKRKKSSLKALSIYLTADNVWIFTARKGMDPQASFDGTPVNNYAPSRTIMLGVNVGL